MKAEHRDIAKRIRSRDTKDVIVANRYIAVAISRDEMHATRSIDREGRMHKEMRLLVHRRSLSAIIEVSTRGTQHTSVVMVTNSIDSALVKFAIGIQEMLKDLNVANGARSDNCSTEKKLVNGRHGASAITLRKSR